LKSFISMMENSNEFYFEIGDDETLNRKQINEKKIKNITKFAKICCKISCIYILHGGCGAFVLWLIFLLLKSIHAPGPIWLNIFVPLALMYIVWMIALVILSCTDRYRSTYGYRSELLNPFSFDE
jgi:hypothetical protein